MEQCEVSLQKVFADLPVSRNVITVGEQEGESDRAERPQWHQQPQEPWPHTCHSLVSALGRSNGTQVPSTPLQESPAEGAAG